MTVFWTSQGPSVCQFSSRVLRSIAGLQHFNFGYILFSSQECLGLHLGNPQSANLGDGNGFVDETVKADLDIRNQLFFIISCVDGASSWLFWSNLWHLLGEYSWREPFSVCTYIALDKCVRLNDFTRSLYRQNGPTANSSALFLAWVPVLLFCS